MDLSCIISSGDLELYVLGMLPPAEMQQVEQLISIFPEVRAEVDRISRNLEELSNRSELTPRPGVKDRLFDSLEQLKKQDPAPEKSKLIELKPDQVLNAGGDRQPVPGKIKRRSNYLAAASFAGLLLAISALLFLNNQNRSRKEQIASLKEEVSRQKDTNLAYNNLLQILQNDQFTRINLEAVAGKPKSEVKVFWNRKSKEVYLMDMSLPSPPPGKQYQLWAIVNGKPENAGMLTDKKMVVQKMAGFETAEAFAITLEKEGGSEKPTMEEMFVMGKAS